MQLSIEDENNTGDGLGGYIPPEKSTEKTSRKGILKQIDYTKFRSLKYGGDRLNGGSSNQPYIQTSIPENSPGTGGSDFLLRGGTLLPVRVARDVSRLTQMFADTRSLNGLLFTAKQEALGLSEVNTAAGYSGVKSFASVNRKLYLPTSTIAQAAITPLGQHISKQGLIPVNISETLFNSVLKLDKESRLSNLYDQHILNYSIGNILYSYSGGPGSVGGIGSTRIKLASDRTGKNNKNYKLSLLKKKDYRNQNITLTDNENANNHPFYTNNDYRKNDELFRLGASSKFNEITNQIYLGESVFQSRLDDFDESTGQAKSYNQKLSTSISSSSSLTYEQIIDKSSIKQLDGATIQEDFRTQLTGSVLYSRSLDYKTKGIEGLDKRINFNPQKRDISNYAYYSKSYEENFKNAYDQINALDIYKSSNVNKPDSKNDLVKFRIAVINNETPSESTYMHFRAYIDSFSDSYSSQWDDVNYVGRGEKFHRYTGFNREISLSWTVVAHSREELAPMYRKLNYLASSLAPYYSESGYMSGNLVKLTIGGYLYEQPGIITSLTYDVPQEATWETGLNSGGDSIATDVKELPHMIRITGVKFIPIHNFVPQLFDGKKGKQKERFIALSNGYGDERTLYDDVKYSGY